ncbi:uncharacterized protein LOC134274954 isoform X1 [Saccostrea cucullata]|uniref:uncharacterized protein LOC134274954 isoform X1 n=1 Tax=Saccostrea cuccullata TaxID=36930 RepID=UPI002ED19DAF
MTSKPFPLNMTFRVCVLILFSSIHLSVCMEDRIQYLERLIVQLQENQLIWKKEMYTVRKENAKLREIVEDLETRLISQENRIKLFENGIEECQSNDKDLHVLSKETKIMTTSEEINLNTPQNPPERQSKSLEPIPAGRLKHPRINTVIHDSENIAFFSFLSQSQDTPSHSHIIVFDSAPTDPGNHYNRFSGIFTVPKSGTYVFTWTIYCDYHGFLNTQLIINQDVFVSSYCNADGVTWYKSSTATAVAKVTQGDVVFIRTHSSETNKGQILSNHYLKTTFAGWFLF